MKSTFALLALSLAMTTSAAALAQAQGYVPPSGTAGPATTDTMTAPQREAQAPLPPARQTTSTRAPSRSSTLTEFQLPPDVLAQLRQQSGRKQRPLELVQTYLLNKFGELGFSELRSIDKVGETYVASVLTPAREPVKVVIDPATGRGTVIPQTASAQGVSPSTSPSGADVLIQPGGVQGTSSLAAADRARMGTAGSTGAAAGMGAGTGQTSSLGTTMSPGAPMQVASVDDFMSRYQCTTASLSELSRDVGGAQGTQASELQPMVQAAMEAHDDGNNSLCQLRLRQIGQVLASR